MNTRSWERVATDKPTVVAESLFDTIATEDSQSDGGFANSTRADESDGREIVGEVNDLFDQFVAPETGPRRRRRQLSGRYAIYERKNVGPTISRITDLFSA